MSQPQAALHGDALLQALTAVALEVQRARTVEEVLSVAGEGLSALGFAVAVVTTDGEAYGIRYVNVQGPLSEVAQAVTAQRPRLDKALVLQRVLASRTAVFLDDVPDQVATLFPQLDESTHGGVRDALKQLGLRTLVMAPLTVRGQTWGALCLLHARLSAADRPAFTLFSLQLGCALEMAQTMEQLQQRTAELDLVHALASAGLEADASGLTLRALETVCRSTTSDAAALHRYDEKLGVFSQVGATGLFNSAVLEQWASFSLPQGMAEALRPRAMAAEVLPRGSRELVAEGFREVAILPLSPEARLSGMLTLVRRAPRPYDAGDLHTAEILGVQALSLVGRTRLYEDLKASYQELERAQAEVVRHERLAALGELAAVMAHEVRNPLGVIFNSLATLKRLLTPTGDAEMLLEMVGEEAERLNRIVGDLLDFVRPWELTKEAVDIGPVITAAIGAAVQVTAAEAVNVVTDVPADLPRVQVDPHLLRQALVNLVVNAVQALPRGGTVTVRARLEPRPAGPWLVLEVADQGVACRRSWRATSSNPSSPPRPPAPGWAWRS